MEDLDNVKLIALFESMTPGSTGVPSQVTVTMDIDSLVHLHARALRVFRRATEKLLYRTLCGWKLRTQWAPAPSDPQRRRHFFHLLRKPLCKPEFLETAEVWRISINKEGAVHVRAASLKKALRVFRYSFRLSFYKWKLGPSKLSPQQHKGKAIGRTLLRLVLDRCQDAWVCLRKTVPAKAEDKSSSQLLDKSFEIQSEDKASFGLEESLDIDPDDELHYILGIDVKRLKPQKAPSKPITDSAEKPISRDRLLAAVCCRGNLRWFYLQQKYIAALRQNTKGLPKVVARGKRVEKLQALVRGFLVRLHLRVKQRMQKHCTAPEMWLLIFACRRHIRDALKAEDGDVHSRIAYALKFKKLLRRVNGRRELQRASS